MVISGQGGNPATLLPEADGIAEVYPNAFNGLQYPAYRATFGDWATQEAANSWSRSA